MFPEHTPGLKQFELLYAFTSLDAHAEMLCNGPCLSDVDAVADPDRLTLKFGRAGWYSLSEGRDTGSDCPLLDANTILRGIFCDACQA
jgi:hypothetical protein